MVYFHPKIVKMMKRWIAPTTRLVINLILEAKWDDTEWDSILSNTFRTTHLYFVISEKNYWELILTYEIYQPYKLPRSKYEKLRWKEMLEKRDSLL